MLTSCWSSRTRSGLNLLWSGRQTHHWSGSRGFLTSLPYRDYRTDENSDRQRRLTALPPTLAGGHHYHPPVGQQLIRWHASSTTTTSTSNNETGNSKDNTTTKETATRTDRLRQRAGEISHSARERFEEFREHPQESAKQGAKTFGGMVRLYGPVFVGTYATVYFTTLGCLFAGIETGALDPVVLLNWLGVAGDESKNTVSLVVDFLNNHTITQAWAPYVERNPSVANLAVAWIAVKFTEPVRFALTLGITPRVARYLGYAAPAAAQQAKGEEEETKKGEPSAASATTETKPQEPGANCRQ